MDVVSGKTEGLNPTRNGFLLFLLGVGLKHCSAAQDRRAIPWMEEGRGALYWPDKIVKTVLLMASCPSA